MNERLYIDGEYIATLFESPEVYLNVGGQYVLKMSLCLQNLKINKLQSKENMFPA